jgi:hypothetical protein
VGDSDPSIEGIGTDLLGGLLVIQLSVLASARFSLVFEGEEHRRV